MDVIKRMSAIMKKKGLTDYQLAKMSDLSPSTISNMRTRNTVPSISTLEHICDAMDIPLSQFFIVENTELYPLTPEHKTFMDCFILLPKDVQDSIIKLVLSINSIQG